MNYGRKKRTGGFSLLEVIIALGLLAFGAVAVIGMYVNNARDAQKARDEVVLAVMMRDIRSKSQLAAYFAFEPTADARYPSGFKSTFDKDAWLPRGKKKDGSEAPNDHGGIAQIEKDGDKQKRSPDRDPTPDEEAYNEQMWEHPDDPVELFDASGQLKAGLNYEDLKGVKARYDFLAGEKAHSWDENPMYTRFQFRLRTVLPPAWENNQYVDWDGYGRIREDEIGHDLNGDGDITEFAKSFYSHRHTDQADYGIPFARPSHGVVYDPRGMRFYMKRIKCLIGYRLNDPKTTLPKPVTDADPKRGIYSGSRHEFTFSVYNPDVRKK